MITTIAIVLFYLFVPAVVLRLCHLSKMADKIGAVLICYLVGMVFGALVINEERYAIPDTISTIMIPLALPMLLFEVNIRNWSKMAGKAFLSMLVAVFGLVLVVLLGYSLFKESVPEAEKVSGMLAGVYTGGTPNLASIKTALGVPEDMYIAINTVDMLISAVYLLFLLSYAKPLLNKILPSYQPKHQLQQNETNSPAQEELKLALIPWLKKVKFRHILAAFGVTLLCAAGGAGLGFLVKNPAYQMAVIILSITTLGIIAANFKPVKKIQGSFDTGMYLILIFSVAVASMADFKDVSSTLLPLIGLLTFVIFGSMLLHLLFCKLLKIDTDTAMVTSVALVCSPPFVPVVCGAIKNREVMISGITVGVVGYALGNYLGIAIAYLLQSL
ncbi:MAG: DUF819 family protein [Bacteroidales bacterium]|nr:DUF819 family protein [Bacteroidales bacterium]MDD3431039.1 DUF819 family protein [Bacteroidales bacterium]MDD4361597.1 DUF819 family protein [Bacteroidales bacterium]MDD4430590.1 DUF819 family protein [Bacteroidales bacterium]